MPSRRRHTLSVSRRFYDRLSRYCFEHDLPVARFVDERVNAAMDVPYVERPLVEPPMRTLTARSLTPRAAVYTCTQCGERGHNAASHDVQPERYELLSDLRVRQRELHGRDVTRGEILEAGILEVLG
jgi:hypothetical protein